jgi:hypothetical protein
MHLPDGNGPQIAQNWYGSNRGCAVCPVWRPTAALGAGQAFLRKPARIASILARSAACWADSLGVGARVVGQNEAKGGPAPAVLSTWTPAAVRLGAAPYEREPESPAGRLTAAGSAHPEGVEQRRLVLDCDSGPGLFTASSAPPSRRETEMMIAPRRSRNERRCHQVPDGAAQLIGAPHARDRAVAAQEEAIAVRGAQLVDDLARELDQIAAGDVDGIRWPARIRWASTRPSTMPATRSSSRATTTAPAAAPGTSGPAAPHRLAPPPAVRRGRA